MLSRAVSAPENMARPKGNNPVVRIPTGHRCYLAAFLCTSQGVALFLLLRGSVRKMSIFWIAVLPPCLGAFYLYLCHSIVRDCSQHAVEVAINEILTALGPSETLADFPTLVALISLSPSRSGERQWTLIQIYWRLLSLVRRFAAPFSVLLRTWLDQELSACCSYAAVVLSARILRSRQETAHVGDHHQP